MSLDRDSQNVDNRSKDQTPIDLPTQSADDKHTLPIPIAQKADQHKPRAVQSKRGIEAREQWLVGLGIATLLVNIAIALIYYGQLCEMQKATKATQDAVKISRDTLEADKVQANLSDVATNKALQATIDNFKQDQRAWVSVSKVDVVPEVGKPLSFTVHQVNTGKTPAREVSSYMAGERVSRGSSPQVNLDKMQRGGYIAPNNEYLATVNLTRLLPTGFTQRGMEERLEVTGRRTSKE